MASATPRSISRSNGKPNRPSQSQPTHRRPEWAKNERSYHRYIEDLPNREYTREDYGYDNFSYHAPYLDKLMLPPNLIPRLPVFLGKEVKLFVLAFAAVYTAFERIEALDKDDTNRIDPRTTHKHMLGRRESNYSPTVPGAETPPSYSTPTTQEMTMPFPHASSMKKSQIHTIPHVAVNMVGLESPPFTPLDSQVSNTPINGGMRGIEPADLARLNAKLSNTALDTDLPSMSVHNEIAYQVYVNQYNAEIADMKCHAFKRLEGFNRTIAVQFYEHSHDTSLTMDQKAALQQFKPWWTEAKKKMTELKVRVDALQEKKFGLPPTQYGQMMRLVSGPI